MNILVRLADHARFRVAEAKKSLTSKQIKERALSLDKGDFAFERALKTPGVSFICECKKASPSKGVIDAVFPYLDIARDYEAAGADAVSVLTEPKWFLGDDRYLEEISNAVNIPCLRKDFIVDEYMIYQAALLGAKAALLICALLPEDTVRQYIEVCDALGISALVEVHDETEAKAALNAGARVIGVNNRNLKDFSVDTGNSARIRDVLPDTVTFVAESGVACRGDVAMLENIGVDAVLVGEALMRAPDKKAKLQELKFGHAG